MGTWQTYNGSSWVAASSKPGSSNSVYIQSGHTVTLNANEACKDLHIAKGNSNTNATFGRVALSTYNLEVSGKLRNYYAAVNTIPGTSTTTMANVPITTGGGVLRIVGSTRTLVSATEWTDGTYAGATNNFPIVFAPDSGATITLNSTLRAQSWTINSGTVSMASTALVHADNGTNYQGDVTVNSNAVLILSGTGASASVVRRSSGKRGGTFTVNGTLRFTGAAPYLAMSTIAFNGTVEYAGSSQTLAYFGGDGAVTPNTYTNLVILGSGTTTVPFNLTINGNLHVETGSTLSHGTYTVNVANAGTYAREVTASGSVVVDLPSFVLNSHTWDTDATLSTFASSITPTVTFAWKPVEVDLYESGATFTITGASMVGKTIKIRHSLGFTPLNLYWRLKNNLNNWGSWNEVTTGLDGTFAEFTVPAKAQGDLQVVFPEAADTGVTTLPIELSSFTAIPTAEYFVELHWITQSETAVTGYVIYRSQTLDLSDAIALTGLIEATNTANETEYTFVDNEVSPGTWYYWLAINEFDGSHAYHGPLQVLLFYDQNDPDIPEIPVTQGLTKVFPNPFNPSTTISFVLIAEADVEIAIYNLKDERVRSLFTGYQDAGHHNMAWDGRSDSGNPCGSGIYFVRLKSNDIDQTRKMVLTK